MHNCPQSANQYIHPSNSLRINTAGRGQVSHLVFGFCLRFSISICWFFFSKTKTHLTVRCCNFIFACHVWFPICLKLIPADSPVAAFSLCAASKFWQTSFLVFFLCSQLLLSRWRVTINLINATPLPPPPVWTSPGSSSLDTQTMLKSLCCSLNGINSTHAWPGASARRPVEPVVELRVWVQTEIHGAKGSGLSSLRSRGGIFGFHGQLIHRRTIQSRRGNRNLNGEHKQHPIVNVSLAAPQKIGSGWARVEQQPQEAFVDIVIKMNPLQKLFFSKNGPSRL